MLSFVTTALNFIAIRFLTSGNADNSDPFKGFEYLVNLINGLNVILWPLLIVVASAATIFAVYIGVMMAKADDSGERDKFKAKFINVIVAMAITVAIILVLKLVVVPGLNNWLA